ncbi:MAG: RNA 2',3'-cyclic phosphodiesterase [Planctomycetales bacterium]|nr:RNA 2',3'-cyclic phosphodiesterase [Planctomycetales bacterium]
MQTTRSFIGIDLGPAASAAVARLLQKLRGQTSAVRWVEEQQLHLTIKFLGELDNVLLPGVCANLRAVCQHCEPFRLSLGELGTFPRGKPPRVVWVGIDDPESRLQALYERLDEAFVEYGLPRESRGFSPHLTLGRVKSQADTLDLQTKFDQLPGLTATEFEVEEIHLLASVKQGRTTQYEPIDTVELAGVM